MAFAGIYQSRIALITHTFEVERELARLVGTMQEAELAARGYVRTMDEASGRSSTPSGRRRTRSSMASRG